MTYEHAIWFILFVTNLRTSHASVDECSRLSQNYNIVVLSYLLTDETTKVPKRCLSRLSCVLSCFSRLLLHSNTLDKNKEFTKLKILTFCRASSYVICGKIKRRTADILIPHESAITVVS